jgi:hypothetical protein
VISGGKQKDLLETPAPVIDVLSEYDRKHMDTPRGQTAERLVVNS